MSLWIAFVPIAGARVWTDATGVHSTEAEFVKLEGDVVTLKLASGALTTIPLEKLSAADQAFAKSHAKEPDPASPPDPPGADPGAHVDSAAPPSDVSAKAVLRTRRGKSLLHVEVNLIGGDAADGSAFGKITVDPIVTGGKSFPGRKYSLSLGEVGPDGFEKIDRSQPADRSDHPKDGIQLNIEYLGVPADLKEVDAIRGTVSVMVEGSEVVIPFESEKLVVGE